MIMAELVICELSDNQVCSSFVNLFLILARLLACTLATSLLSTSDNLLKSKD